MELIRAVQVQGMANPAGFESQNQNDIIEPGTPGCVQDPAQQGGAAKGQQLFGLSHAGPASGRQDDTGNFLGLKAALPDVTGSPSP